VWPIKKPKTKNNKKIQQQQQQKIKNGLTTILKLGLILGGVGSYPVVECLLI
jgi:hypothetical protein